MAEEGEVSDHLLVGKLVPFGALDHPIQHQDVPVVATEKTTRTSKRGVIVDAHLFAG